MDALSWCKYDRLVTDPLRDGRSGQSRCVLACDAGPNRRRVRFGRLVRSSERTFSFGCDLSVFAQE